MMLSIQRVTTKPSSTRFGATISVDKSAQTPFVQSAIDRNSDAIGDLPRDLWLEYSVRTNRKKGPVAHLDVYHVAPRSHAKSLFRRRATEDARLLQNFVNDNPSEELPNQFIQRVITSLRTASERLS